MLQIIAASSTREAWLASARGLSAADMTMQIVLPEFDGRIAIGPIAFKEEAVPDPLLGYTGRRQIPDPDGIALAADQVRAWVDLRRTPPDERRLALILSDYPARGGRAGFAVGLDTPASVCRILDCLAEAGYDAGRTFDVERLMRALTGGAAPFAIPLEPLRGLALDPVGDAAQRHRGRLGRAGSRSRCWSTGRSVSAALRAGQGAAGAAAGSRPRGRSQGLLPRPRRAPDPRLSGVLSRSAGDRARRRADPSRHARNHRMAPRQGGGAVRRLRAAARDGRAAGHLSLHRRRSGRSGARQATAERRSPSAT